MTSDDTLRRAALWARACLSTLGIDIVHYEQIAGALAESAPQGAYRARLMAERCKALVRDHGEFVALLDGAQTSESAVARICNPPDGALTGQASKPAVRQTGKSALPAISAEDAGDNATLRHEHGYGAYLRHRDDRTPAMTFEEWLEAREGMFDAAQAVADFEHYREGCGEVGGVPVPFPVFHPIWLAARKDQWSRETVAAELRRAEAVVAQTSESAVARISKSAGGISEPAGGRLEAGGTADLEVCATHKPRTQAPQ